MIVPSMSYVEIYRKLDEDIYKVNIWANKLLPKVVKEFKKRNKPIDWLCHEYEHQESRNKYLISYHAPDRSAYEHPDIKIYGVIVDNGKRLIVQWGWVQWGSVFVRNLSFYRGHFFKRYRERLWPDCPKPMNEQICRYFTRNDNVLKLNFKGHVFIKLNEDIKRDYDKYGDNAGLGLMVKDGLCFVDVGQEGDVDLAFDKDCKFVTIVMYNTIVNKSTLTEGQKLAIKKELESNMEAMSASIKEKLVYLHRLQMLEGDKPELKDYF